MGEKRNRKTRILIIDDHPLFREGLKSIINRDRRFKVTGEAGNARDGLDAVRRIRPDLVTVDLALPDQNGIGLITQIRSYLPETSVIVITMHCHIDYVIQAIQAGALAYLLKESTFETLFKAIETVLRSEYFLDTALSNEVAKKLMAPPEVNLKARDAAYGSLTRREQEVMRLLAEGIPRIVIAEKLFITQKTLENHTTRILNKLSLHDTRELVTYAAKLGLIDEVPEK